MTARAEWEAARTRIQERSRGLRQRLLPGIVWSFDVAEIRKPGHWIGVPDYSTPPPKWKCWVCPKSSVPIDAAITALINKKQTPRLQNRVALVASGIACPYWYARAGIILAIEAAELAAIEANDARRDHKAKVQQLRSLESVGKEFTSRTMEDLTKMVHAVKAVDAGVRLNPQTLSLRVRGQGDELWDSFVATSNKFYDCVDRIEAACTAFEANLQRLLEIAREARLSLVNNPPDAFRRTFVEEIQGDFQLLTGLREPSWGPVFHEFLTAAWDSAELPQELKGERLIRSLRQIK